MPLRAHARLSGAVVVHAATLPTAGMLEVPWSGGPLLSYDESVTIADCGGAYWQSQIAGRAAPSAVDLGAARYFLIPDWGSPRRRTPALHPPSGVEGSGTV